MTAVSGSPSQRHVEETLKAVLAQVSRSPERLSAIIEERNEPLLAFTAQRRIVAANVAGERFFGYERGALAQAPTDHLVPERFRQPDAPAQLATPDLTTVELPGLHRDGSELPTVWTFGAADSPAGPVFVLLLRDRRKLVTEFDALQRSDGRYRSLLLASADIVWIANPEGHVSERQAAWEAYTGQVWDEYQGTGWISAIHPDDREQVMSDWLNAIRAGAASHRTQGRIWSARHGSWRSFQTRGVAVCGPAGDVVEWVSAVTDVQDVVEAREALATRERELEGRFRAIYENALDGILLSNDALRIVDVNPAACRILGRTREQLLGCHMTDLMPEGERDRSVEALGQEFRSAGRLTGVGLVRLPDGSVRRSEFGAVANISPGLHLSVFRDVEDRLRAEDAQLFLDEASRLLVASLDYDETLASVVKLAVPRIADWAAIDLVTDEGSLRRVAVVHVDPEKIALAHELRKRQQPTLRDQSGVGAVVRTGKAELVELVTDEVLVAALAEKPDLLPLYRSLGLVSGMTVPLSARGRVIGAISLVSAESRRRFGPADLAVALELSRRATYAVENAMFVRDLRVANETKDVFLRRAEYLQATATKLVRADSVAAIASLFEAEHPVSHLSVHGWSLFLRVDDRLEYAAATPDLRGLAQRWSPLPLDADTPLTLAARTGHAVWLEGYEEFIRRYPQLASSLQRDLGSRAALPLSIGGQVIGALGITFRDHHGFDEHERAYLSAIADLWAQALHRARLAEAERDAIARSLEAETSAARKKDEFLAMLGHELRNPLAPILTATGLIRQRGQATERELNILERQSRHLVRLVDDLLDISRITSGKLSLQRSSMDVCEAVSQAMESTLPTFQEKGVRLVPELPAPPVRIEGDRERIVQVVTNVLVNASKFTPRGKSVFLTASVKGERVELVVRDEGQGIDPELLPRVFDLFSQGRQGPDRSRGGLGLGLAIARNIVSAHQGRIEVSSGGVGQGTAVTIELPCLSRATLSAPPSRAGERLSATTGKRRLLIVDDNADGADLLAAFLSDVGYECFVAATGRAGLQLAKEALPDAAILDIGLPDLDGYELARALRGALLERAPKLIALTGYAQQGDRQRAMSAGFAAHLAKPVDMADLVDKLGGLLGHNSAA